MNCDEELKFVSQNRLKDNIEVISRNCKNIFKDVFPTASGTDSTAVGNVNTFSIALLILKENIIFNFKNSFLHIKTCLLSIINLSVLLSVLLLVSIFTFIYSIYFIIASCIKGNFRKSYTGTLLVYKNILNVLILFFTINGSISAIGPNYVYKSGIFESIINSEYVIVSLFLSIASLFIAKGAIFPVLKISKSIPFVVFISGLLISIILLLTDVFNTQIFNTLASFYMCSISIAERRDLSTLINDNLKSISPSFYSTFSNCNISSANSVALKDNKDDNLIDNQESVSNQGDVSDELYSSSNHRRSIEN